MSERLNDLIKRSFAKLPPKGRLAELLAREQGESIPQELRAAWRQSLADESVVDDPRPSAVFRRMERRFKGDRSWEPWLLAHRARLLMLARAALPHQPRTPDQLKFSGDTTVVEAFSGGGLYALALRLEGFEHRALCEWNASAVETLQKNGFKAQITDAFTWVPPKVPYGLDLLTGGPPCTAFSKAAQMKQKEIGPAAPDNMLPLTLDWVADLRPRIVVFENSSELLTTWKDYLDLYLGQLATLGYASAVWHLYAPDYGTPQNRTRAWIVAWPEGASWGESLKSAPKPTHARPGHGDGPKTGLFPWVGAFERLTGGCCGGYGLVDCVNLGNRDHLCRICYDGSNFDPAPNTGADQGRKPLEGLEIGRSAKRSAAEYMMEVMSTKASGGRGQRRIDNANPADMAGTSWAKLEPTARAVTKYLAKAVTSRWSRPPLGLVVPPGLRDFGGIDRSDPAAMVKAIQQLEQMSVRDAAKIQDVPQKYAFSGNRDAGFAQVGNGIAVNMGRAVARHLRVALGLHLVSHFGERGSEELVPDGLWPMDRRDICAGFRGVAEGEVYSAQDAWDDASDRHDHGQDVVDEEERWRDPWVGSLPTPAERPAAQKAAERARGVFPQAPDSDSARIDAHALWTQGWRPSHAEDVPYPLEDLEGFVALLHHADDLARRPRAPVKGGSFELWRGHYQARFGRLHGAWSSELS